MERTNCAIHRLVLEAFVGPCPNGFEACHNDGDRQNNRLENLRWDTRSGNHSDKEQHGTMLRGARHPNAKITWEIVSEIRRRSLNGESLLRLAREFGISRSNVGLIAARKTWNKE
jgi:hypothetical protein